MILQKLASAIRRQDWFQVLIEVLIVIVGIFLGLQVQGWYEDRADRVKEQAYLIRLHQDVMEALNFNEVSFESAILASQFYEFDQYLGEVLDAFEGVNSGIELGPKHCFAIFGSHIYNPQTYDIPSLRELIASGQLELIKSEEVKLSLSRFTFAYEGMYTLVDALVPQALVLSRKYPDLINLDGKMRDIRNEFNFTHECNFTAMQASHQFSNDLIDNAARMKTFVQTLIGQEQILQEVHLALDRELEIVHRELTP